MKIQTFMNLKGLIHGRDPKRIESDKDGVLKIGSTEISVMNGGSTIMPELFHGATGNYTATFTDADNVVYDLGKVEVRNGRIAPPHHTAVEIASLRSRVDIITRENAKLKEKVAKLENVFDTDALNFLIK